MGENQVPLKDRRKAVHLTQQQLADLANVERTLIADVESGRQLLTGANAGMVLKALEMVEAESKQKTVKDILILARTEKGLTQEEVAKRAGLDPLVYSKWEAGLADIGEAIFRVHDAINGLLDEKSKPTAAGGMMKLSALLGKRDHVNEVYERKAEEEAKRVVSAVNARLLSEDVRSLETMAAKVPGLEAENAALKARIAELQKKKHTRKSSKKSGR